MGLRSARAELAPSSRRSVLAPNAFLACSYHAFSTFVSHTMFITALHMARAELAPSITGYRPIPTSLITGYRICVCCTLFVYSICNIFYTCLLHLRVFHALLLFFLFALSIFLTLAGRDVVTQHSSWTFCVPFLQCVCFWSESSFRI